MPITSFKDQINWVDNGYSTGLPLWLIMLITIGVMIVEISRRVIFLWLRYVKKVRLCNVTKGKKQVEKQ